MTAPIPFDEMFTPASAEAWFENMREVAADLVGNNFATSWHQGAMGRTIFAVFANLLGMHDVNDALLLQGGFIDYAATGTVSYQDATGAVITVPVTPDPSNPAENPDGTLGALDVLADGVYNVRRSLSTKAGGSLALLNTTLDTYGPFEIGEYHVAQPLATGAPTYASSGESFSIPPSLVLAVIADVTDAGGLIEIETVDPHGLSDDDVIMIAGVGGITGMDDPTAWAVTVIDADHFTLNNSTFGGTYTSGGSVYDPTIASFTADVAGTASNAATGNLITEAVTSLLGVSVANFDAWLGSDIESNVSLAAKCRLKLQSLSPNGPRGAYEYFARTAHELAPLLTPPLELSSAITRALVQTDLTTGTVTTTIANGTGAPTGDDVLAVEAVQQAHCVPDGVTSIVQAAVEKSVDVDITLWIPAAYVTAANAVATIAVQTFFAVLPIGGVTDADDSMPEPDTNVVPVRALLGSVFAALRAGKIPWQDGRATLDGDEANVELAMMPVPEVATLGTLSGSPIAV